MKRRISREEFMEFMEQHFRSKAHFARELSISYSHLEKIIQGKTYLGERTYAKLCKVCEQKGETVENLLEPLPLNGITEIIVTKGDELIVSLTSRNAVVKDGYEVVCVPCKKS